MGVESFTQIIKCKLGEIKRVNYTYTKKHSKKLIKIKPGAHEGKGKKLIIIPKYDIGLLTQFGYKLSKAHNERVVALRKALKQYPYINALRTLQKSNEKMYVKLDRDLKWLQKHNNKN